MRVRGTVALALALAVVPVAALADPEPAPADPRPFVSGGIYDKPFVRSSNRAAIGGYVDAQFRHERANGFTATSSFLLERINLFAVASLSDRVRFASEIEIEEGGEEIKIELAALDLEIHPAITFRGGVLLSPLGRYNIAHDSPANALVDRPLVSTRIIPGTLSEPGAGFFGALYPAAASRVTYELYVVNGLDGGIVEDEGGTSIPAGRGNFEDNNNTPSLVGRVALSPRPFAELGLSVHTGPYNEFEAEGVRLDGRRDVTIVALDADASWRHFRLTGEVAGARIDVPPFNEFLAGRQRGAYVELAAQFLPARIAALPESRFGAAGRWDFVDLDADRAGEHVRQFTLGLQFHPVADTVFKLDWRRTWIQDAFANEENEAAILVGAASYF